MKMKKFIDFNESAEFKPHMMYKDGKEQKANTHAMHLKLKAAGWGHDKEKLSEKDDPCWDSHEMIGMKKKNGKSVPNCVPKESVDEALNMQQRMARGRQMKRNKSKLARGRLKASKRTASKDVLAKRARKAARSAILSKMTKGMSKSELSPARKRELEKKLEKPAFATKISRVAQKLLPKMRKTEIARRANRNKGSSN